MRVSIGVFFSSRDIRNFRVTNELGSFYSHHVILLKDKKKKFSLLKCKVKHFQYFDIYMKQCEWHVLQFSL